MGEGTGRQPLTPEVVDAIAAAAADIEAILARMAATQAERDKGNAQPAGASGLTAH